MRVSLKTKLKNINTNYTPDIIKDNIDVDTFIKKSIPTYILDDDRYGQLVFFLRSFFEWLATEHNPVFILRNILNYNDIDATVDEFVDIFFRKYFSGLPLDVICDKRLLLKHAMDFSGAKGTEEAYKLLFRILYGENVELYYPGDYLFNTSDGEWRSSKIMKVESTESDITTNKIIGFTIKGINSGASAIIENVESYAISGKKVIDLTITNQSGRFDLSEPVVIYTGTVETGNYYEYRNTNIVNVPRIEKIMKGGSGFMEDYSFLMYNPEYPDDSNYLSIIKVNKIGSGVVESLEIKKAGLNYEIGDSVAAYDDNGILNPNFRAYVSKIGLVGNITEITIQNAGFGFTTEPTLKVISKLGTGAELKANTPNAGYLKMLSFYEIGAHFDQSAIIKVKSPAVTGTSEPAELYIVPDTVSEIYGRFHKYTSHTSNVSIRLQDSQVYQKLSYIIKTGVNYADFIDVVKRLIHPAGYNIASQYFILLSIKLGFGQGMIDNLNKIEYHNFKLVFDTVLLNLGVRWNNTRFNKFIPLRDTSQGIDHRKPGFQLTDIDKYKLYLNDTSVVDIFGKVQIEDLFSRIDDSKYYWHDAYPLSFPSEIKTI